MKYLIIIITLFCTSLNAQVIIEDVVLKVSTNSFRPIPYITVPYYFNEMKVVEYIVIPDPKKGLQYKYIAPISRQDVERLEDRIDQLEAEVNELSLILLDLLTKAK